MKISNFYNEFTKNNLEKYQKYYICSLYKSNNANDTININKLDFIELCKKNQNDHITVNVNTIDILFYYNTNNKITKIKETVFALTKIIR